MEKMLEDCSAEELKEIFYKSDSFIFHDPVEWCGEILKELQFCFREFSETLHNKAFHKSYPFVKEMEQRYGKLDPRVFSANGKWGILVEIEYAKYCISMLPENSKRCADFMIVACSCGEYTAFSDWENAVKETVKEFCTIYPSAWEMANVIYLDRIYI